MLPVRRPHCLCCCLLGLLRHQRMQLRTRRRLATAAAAAAGRRTAHTWSLGGRMRLIMLVPLPRAHSRALINCSSSSSRQVQGPPGCDTQMSCQPSPSAAAACSKRTRLTFQISICLSVSSLLAMLLR